MAIVHPVTGFTDASWFPNLITGACTLFAGLGGASLTLRITGKRQDNDRAIEHVKERNLEQREAIIEVLDAGRAWADSQDGIFLAVATVTDPVEFAKMESVDRHIEVLTRYRKALVRARLVVTVAELAPMVRALSKDLEGVSEHLGALDKSAKKHGRAEIEILAKASAYAESHRRALTQLEAATLDRLVDAVATGTTRRRTRRSFNPVRSIRRSR